MPTLAELRRQVRHTRMPIAGLERPEQVPEPVLRGYGALLATMVMDLSGVLTRVSRSESHLVAQSDQVLEHAAHTLPRHSRVWRRPVTSCRRRPRPGGCGAPPPMPGG